MLILFLVYAGSALMLSVLGASSYSRNVAVLQEGFNERSGILYITQKVQQHDVGGGLRIDAYEGNDALVLIEQESGAGFETWIFIQDGHLSEQVISSGGTIIPAMVQRIMPMKMLDLELSPKNLLRVAVTTEVDTVNVMNLALRSSGGTFNTGGCPPPSPSTARLSEPTVMTPPASGQAEDAVEKVDEPAEGGSAQ